MKRAVVENQESEGEKRKSIANTIAHIQKNDKFYIVNGFSLINYLKLNQPYIPCYAVRKKLGLRNSSNIERR